MRLVFMGTPEFAVPSLRALASRHEVFLVFTQPDRPAGRGRRLLPPPVKTEAQEKELRVVQTENANDPDVLALIQEMRPQVIAVVAYGCILKKPLLDTPSIAPVNLHASLLPKYRGVAPINRAIMNGETVTGVTTIRMDEGIDTGPVLLQQRVEIRPGQTAGELSATLAEIGADLLLKTVDRLEAGALKGTPQDDSKASYAHRLKKSDGLIPWEISAERIVNHVRGVTPWPGAVTYLNGLSMKVLEVATSTGLHAEPAGAVKAPRGSSPEPSGPGGTGELAAREPGTVVSITDEGPVVATGSGHVVLRIVCPEGKRPMSGASWARGRRGVIGWRFSSKA